ncbi:MAG TPA: phosphoribosylglycinamide formyltransferase [Flavipsychrobacter sp.]|nr:phosphoribosylglycinamide formyltransferase [Flavipsychrobacter sp.]
MMHSLVLFASGKGSNAQAIIDYFREHPIAKVSLIVSNKADAGVLDIARKEHIPFLIVDRQSFSQALLPDQIQACNPSLIILAGFLWRIPTTLTDAFRGKIINIHPALLPDHGGKGMYGHHVHNAVLAAGKKETGITIHYVDEVYDSGDIIVQARCKVLEDDTADTLASRIHELEHYFFPRTIDYLLSK